MSNLQFLPIIPEEINFTEVEILSEAQALFYEGQKIGLQLEGGIKETLLNFYEQALPFARKVFETKPWNENEYRQFREPDPDQSFLKFLRAAFTNDHETLAYTQAVVVKMMVTQGWTIEAVQGVGLKRLWRISNIIKLISADDQRRLLIAARELPYREFDAACKEIKAGYHIEPLRDKLISASKTSMEGVNLFLEATKAAGDHRIEGEIIADTLGGVMIEEPEFNTFVKESAIISLLCEIMRYFHNDMQNFPNIKIVAEICIQMIKGYREELPENLIEKYENIFGKDIDENENSSEEAK